MIRIIPFIIYLLSIALYEVIIKDATTIYNAAVNYPCLLVLIVAIYKPELVAMWFGFTAGMVASAGHLEILGWQSLILGLLGLAAYHFRDRLNLESLHSKLILILCGVFIHNILWLIINGGNGFWYFLAVSALAGAVYSTVLGWLFFLVKEKKITLQKIKELF